MPRKPRPTLTQDVQHEKWFKVQCLCRNKEYLDLFEERMKLRETLASLEAPLPALQGLEWDLIRRALAGPEAQPPASEINPEPLDPSRLSAEQLQYIEERLIKEPLLRSHIKARISDWLRRVRLRREPKPERAKRRVKEIENYSKERFGLSNMADPRPFKDAPPEEIGWIGDLFVDSIWFMRPARGGILYTEPIEPGEWKGANFKVAIDWEQIVGSLIERDRYLFLVVDARHPPGRLENDFRRILEWIARLKQSQRLATLPPRPGRSDWKLMLRVWDLHSEGEGPSAIARALWPKKYENDKVTARKRAHYLLAQAQKWISMEWARLG